MKGILKVDLAPGHAVCTLGKGPEPVKAGPPAYYFTQGTVLGVRPNMLYVREDGKNDQDNYLEIYWLNDGTHLVNLKTAKELTVGQEVEISFVPVNTDNIAVSVERV
jgi:hypothetical protein